MSCHFCGLSGKAHKPNCPKPLDGAAYRYAKEQWRVGYDVGRKFGNCPNPNNVLQKMGHGQGIVAAEEAENGYCPSIDGGQW